MPAGNPESRTVHTLRVILEDTEPAIWRVFDIDGSMSLLDLHTVIQAAMGWEDCHLHQFGDRPFHARLRDGEEPLIWLDRESIEDGLPGIDETTETITGALARARGTLWYEYDFGDSWLHRIDTLGTYEAGPDKFGAVILDGAQAAPPEDCGGIGGFEHLLEVLDGPESEERAEKEEWLQWCRGPWNPYRSDAFSPESANAFLRGVVSAMIAQHQPLRDAEARLRELTSAAERPSGETTSHLDALPPAVSGPAAPKLSRAAEFIAQAGRHPGGTWASGIFAARFTEAGIDPFAEAAPVTMPPEGAAAVVPYQRLLRAVGDGLKLTQAGYLPGPVVQQLIADLEWEPLLYSTSAKSERDIHPVRNLRATAITAGLLKVRHNVLESTLTGRRLAADPAGLWAQLVERSIPARTPRALLDATVLELLWELVGESGPGEGYAAVRAGMDMLDYVGADGVDGEALRRGVYFRSDRTALEMVMAMGLSDWADAPVPGREGTRRAFLRAVLEA